MDMLGLLTEDAEQSRARALQNQLLETESHCCGKRVIQDMGYELPDVNDDL